MKKVIDGKLYNTDSAKKLAHWSNEADYKDDNFCAETLYKTKTGNYFIHHYGGAKTRYGVPCGDGWAAGEALDPISPDAAKAWAKEKLSRYEYESIFEVTLRSITNQTRGIVCYDDCVIVCDWATYSAGRLPMMLNNMFPYADTQQHDMTVLKSGYTDDVRKLLPGKIVFNEEDKVLEAEDMEVLWDEHYDLCGLWGFIQDDDLSKYNFDKDGNLLPTEGAWYKLRDCLVIAPYGWA